MFSPQCDANRLTECICSLWSTLKSTNMLFFRAMYNK
jgi:hypothetical protein